MQTKRITDVSGLSHLYQVDNFFFAGQPNGEALSEMKKRGIKRVINIRSFGEMDFSEEEKVCRDLGLEYIQLPLLENGKFNHTNVQKLNDLLENSSDPEFIHCGTANRVAGWSITFLVDKKEMDFSDAVDIAENSGLSNFAFVEEAERYLSN